MKSPSQFPERGFPTTCTGEVFVYSVDIIFYSRTRP